jgi:hypothetical protein
MIVTWTTLQIENKNKKLILCMSQFVSFQRKWIYEHVFFIYHGFMSMFLSTIMDLWACFFHLSWIYEHAFFIYHGFMRMFSPIMGLWACFLHLSWIYEHVFFIYHGFMSMFSSITSSICICDKLYHKKKRKIFFMIMFSFVILCQLLGTFILHVSQFVSYTIMSFLWCQQRAKFRGPSVWHPQTIQKQKQMCNDIFSSSFWNVRAWRHSTFFLK